MLARLLRLILIFELFSYAFIGVLLVKFAGWTPGRALLLMAMPALAWRAWAIVLSYLFAYIAVAAAEGSEDILQARIA